MPRKAILDSSECPRMVVEDNPVPEKRTEKKCYKKLKTDRGGVFSEDDRGTDRRGAGVVVVSSVYAGDARKDEAAYYPRARRRVPEPL